MSALLNSVVIVGGGTAGWLTACIIAAEHGPSASVSLVESPDIPTIGVGEGTWPSMRSTLQKIGIQEVDFLAACDASFKQGTEFRNWVYSDRSHCYHHPFSLPAEYASLNLAEHWLLSEVDSDFCRSVTPQGDAILADRAPKSVGVPDYAFQLNYGYHFDAGKFAALLMRHATERLGVKHILANLTAVHLDEEGAIASVDLDRAESMTGQLFVDCTGQKGLLIGDALGVPLDSLAHVLPNDRAVVTQVPYSISDNEIASATRSTAQSAGWIWDIGLQSRRGVGYVHSSAFISEDEAIDTLRDYVRASQPQLSEQDFKVRTVPFTPGKRRVFWQKNCVAIGLSAGFIEPLEASAIALIEQAATKVSEALPLDQQSMGLEAAQFNQRMHEQWDQISEFLQLHYALSQRSDSEYWRQVRSEQALLPSLKDKLARWSRHSIWHADAPRFDELFPAASYQYVFYGMQGRVSQPSPHRRSFQTTIGRADAAMHDVKERKRSLVASLPSNRELLSHLCRTSSPNNQRVSP